MEKFFIIIPGIFTIKGNINVIYTYLFIEQIKAPGKDRKMILMKLICEMPLSMQIDIYRLSIYFDFDIIPFYS